MRIYTYNNLTVNGLIYLCTNFRLQGVTDFGSKMISQLGQTVLYMVCR